MFHRVDLFLNIVATILTGTWHTIAFIPEGYRPYGYAYLSCEIYNGDGWINAECLAYNNDGTIKIYTLLPDGNYTIRVHGTYSVDV